VDGAGNDDSRAGVDVVAAIGAGFYLTKRAGGSKAAILSGEAGAPEGLTS
jgi:hypothetical protein